MTKLSWMALSKSIILLRQVRLTTEEGEKDYYVFLIHTPTVFKTRGRYVLIETTDKDKLGLLRDMTGYKFSNFRLNDLNQVISTVEGMPFLALNSDIQGFIDIYHFDNSSELKVIDILDLLEFISLKKGLIHFDPGVGESFIEENDEFRMSDNEEDYVSKTPEFVTSREKPSLSYGYLLYGERTGEEGRTYTTRKYFKYSVINDAGEVEKAILKFSIPEGEKAREHIETYLGHLLVPDSLELNEGKNRLEFLINTSELQPIETLHELPVTKQLLIEREKARVMVRSLREFKGKMAGLSSKVGIPLTEKYDNRFVYGQMEEKKEGEFTVVSRTKYTTQETREGDLPVKEIYKKINIPRNYIDILVTKYLNGEEGVNRETVVGHINRAMEVFDSEILGEAFKSLFVCIPSHDNIRGMFDESDHLAKMIDTLGNSLKLRLHVFGLTDSKEGQAFLYRMISGGAKITLNNDYGMVRMEYTNEGKQDGVIEMTVDAKM